MDAVLSREVARKMPLKLQQYKQVTEFSGAFCFLQSRLEPLCDARYQHGQCGSVEGLI